MILKSATNTKAYINELLFTKNARTAWEHILASTKASSLPVNVLMPSYIGHTDREGSGVFDPLVAQSAHAEFYKVNEDLSINMAHFESLITTNKFSVALVIHYFGFCKNDMNLIKELCVKNDVLLIEDCAHAFQIHNKVSKLGSYGDFSFYSLHKYLPTDSGGILKNNSGRIPSAILPLDWGIALVDLVQYNISDFAAIAEKRRENYARYEQLLPNSELFEVMYRLEDSDVPQTFPIKVKNGLREKLYFFLMEKEAPTTALYYRMIKEISIERFPTSHQIAGEILNLPVHQDTEKEDIVIICNLIKDFMTNNTGVN